MFRYSTSSANSSNRRSSTKPRSKPSDLSGQGSRRDDGIAPRCTRHGIEGVLRALRFLVLDAREHSGSEGAGARRHRYGEGDVKSPSPLQGASGSAQFGCFSFGGGESFHCACDELADISCRKPSSSWWGWVAYVSEKLCLSEEGPSARLEVFPTSLPEISQAGMRY